MKAKALICSLIAVLFYTLTSLAADNISLIGYLRNETDYRLSSGSGFVKSKYSIYSQLKTEISPSISLTLGGKFSYDAIFGLRNIYPSDVRNDQELIVSLRDLYVDVGLSKLDLRIGKQQVVWGEAILVSIADLINPQDLREFILSDLEERRIPLWSIDAKYFLSDLSIEGVWVWINEFNKLGVDGSEFEFQPFGNLSSNIILLSNASQKPTNSIRNSQLGLRLSYYIGGWDINFFHFYGFNHNSTLYRTVANAPEPGKIIMTVNPEYERCQITGLSFAKTMEPLVIRGEVAYAFKAPFVTSNILDADGIVKSDYLSYVLGLDYPFFEKVEAYLQLFQDAIVSYKGEISQDKRRTYLILLLQTPFSERKINLRCELVFRIERDDYFARPQFTYHFSDSLEFTLGAAFFGGSGDGMFGEFRDRDRVFVSTTFTF